MTTFDLVTSAQIWDMDYATRMIASGVADASVDRRRYSRLLDVLTQVAPIKYQPYQNDTVQHYVSKLRQWVQQFQPAEQPYAFLLAAQVLFVTEPQFEALLRLLYTTKIRRELLDSIIGSQRLPLRAYSRAMPLLEQEMDNSIFVANSLSSHLNAFTHINRDFFHQKAQRRLIGPPIDLLIYPQRRLLDKTLTAAQQATLAAFERDVLATDPQIAAKDRIVVIEDFSGSGSDLIETVSLLASSDLPFKHILLAPVIITSTAKRMITDVFAHLPSRRTYSLVFAFELFDRFRCFDTPVAPTRPSEPSYLEAVEAGLSNEVQALSSRIFDSHFTSILHANDKDGFAGLALAFVMFSNCPDNSLPMLWRSAPGFAPLFKRASKYL
jgi:hypothetical protein